MGRIRHTLDASVRVVPCSPTERGSYAADSFGRFGRRALGGVFRHDRRAVAGLSGLCKRPVHRGVAQGYRARARRRGASGFAVRGRMLARPDDAADRSAAADRSRTSSVRGNARAVSRSDRLPGDARGVGGVRAPAAPVGGGSVGRCAPRCGAGGHHELHEHRRRVSLRRCARHRCGADHAFVPRPAVPSCRPRVHGHGVSGAVDAHRRRARMGRRRRGLAA